MRNARRRKIGDGGIGGPQGIQRESFPHGACQVVDGEHGHRKAVGVGRDFVGERSQGALNCISENLDGLAASLGRGRGRDWDDLAAETGV
jgi:hypothetical protein